MKEYIIKNYAAYLVSKVKQDRKNAISDQEKVMNKLIRDGQNTAFGRDHKFSEVRNAVEFADAIPVRDYEGIKSYVDRIIAGEHDVLWKGKPRYFAKTSGTTSGVKYIPITNESIHNHIHSARYALMNYVHLSGKVQIFNGKLIFLSGSPELQNVGNIPTGRLSGIVNHEIPAWIKLSQLPSLKTNLIEDWEEKLERIIDETLRHDMRLISGIPPWVQMYYERLLEKTGKSKVIDVFPNYSLFMYGGVNFEPYRESLRNLIGADIDSIETYPASEGFIAWQDSLDQEGLLLNTNSGIYFEFIPLEEAGKEKPTRLNLDSVEIGKDYALVINNNAGLWGYDIGDCVRFVSLNPYRLIVSGRVKHYISAFGEHVISKEVEEAISVACAKTESSINEFTVAPQILPPEGGLPYHEWLIEFDKAPDNKPLFAEILDQEMCRQNIYYNDLIVGKILRPLKVTPMTKGSFIQYMKEEGKLGGQNKTPRLTNDRKIADKLYVINQ
jgi:hypothetical protein